MNICIYCKKGVEEVTFRGEEHVVPELLGKFDYTPKISNLICDNCNSIIFSRLETFFKEDTDEGLRYQMHNFEKKYHFRVGSKRAVMGNKSGFDDKFFDGIFPLIKYEDGKFLVELKPQIQVRNYGENGYHVYLVEALKKNKDRAKKFNEVKEIISKANSKDITIYTVGDDKENSGMQETIELLKDYGVNYKEGQRRFSPKVENQQFEYEISAKIDRDVARVIAKISLNYIIFCASREKKCGPLFGNKFKNIIDFINGDEKIKIKDIIISLNENVIFDQDRETGQRVQAHQIVFYSEKNNIISEITLLGGNVYKIIIGEMPDEWKNSNFGCGHLFNPFNKKIFRMTQNKLKRGSFEEKITTYGLFLRF